ncbi:hypothetical protein FL583_05020 [Cryptosporangium phraense]|uniref:Uncharacterized protein n=1 Tax=Cryptosporangium phraense TaxID=2593070 RepID=A0A545AY16_9ACTN|nr:hypothetical protein FL583_05020 [Cryptosporangium phraense]
MDRTWQHIGRLWTNGEPYLAIDADSRHHWLGFSQDEYFDRIVDLNDDQTAIAVGPETAAVVGADGVVRDDSWKEVFESADGTIAIVQASGDDYRQTVAAALKHVGDPTGPSALINVGSGEIAIFSAASDGTGHNSMTLLPARAGETPSEHGSPTSEPDTGLLVTAWAPQYRVDIWTYTELDDSSCFARWLLVPVQPDSA